MQDHTAKEGRIWCPSSREENYFKNNYLLCKLTAGYKELQGTGGGKLIDFKNIDLPKDSEDILDGETFFMSDCNEEWAMTRDSFINLL